MTDQNKTLDAVRKLTPDAAKRVLRIARSANGFAGMDKRAANGLIRRGLAWRMLDDTVRHEWGSEVARLATVALTALGEAVAAELEKKIKNNH